MEGRITIEKRDNRDRRTHRDKSGESREAKYGSQSPTRRDSNPRVVILAKNPSSKSNTSSSVSQIQQHAQPTKSSIQIIQSSQQQRAKTPTNLSGEDAIGEMIANMPDVMKLIDGDSLLFNESPASDFLFSDSISSGGFSTIAAVGLDCVGKSGLLNKIADREVFATHANSKHTNVLRHITKGIDLHCTKERLLLLDTQPLLSASVLDEFLYAPPSVQPDNQAESEHYAFMTSLQMMAFLLTVCDYVIIVSNWSIDLHLIKLISTALMMAGDGTHKADMIWYFTKRDSNFDANTIKHLFGRSISVTMICEDENELVKTVMKAPNRRVVVGENGTSRSNNLNVSEKSWLLSAQRVWESIRKSTLYSEYGRFLP